MASNPSQFPQAVVGGSPSFASLTVTGGITSAGLPVPVVPAGSLAVPVLALQAQTPVAGVALINGTQNFITWTPPNDGLIHRVIVFVTIVITSLETGGAVGLTINGPGGNSLTNGSRFSAGGGGVGNVGSFAINQAQANSAITVNQTSALTAGAATCWAEIWGS